jgi:hypothetical protein
VPSRDHLRPPGAQSVAGRPIVEHVGLTFTGPISVDGNRYINCIFERCVVTYGGGVPPSFSGCSFHDSKLSFVGAAANTLLFLKAMAAPNSGLQRVIHETFPGFSGH